MDKEENMAETPTLFQLTGDFLSLMNMEYPEIYEDDTEEDIAEKQSAIEAFEGTMNMLIESIDDKIDNYCYVIEQLQGENETAKTAKKKLDALIKSRERKIERLKNALANSMVLTERKSIETPLHRVNVRSSESVKLIHGDKAVEFIPEEYRRVKEVIEPDKTLIKKVLKSGEVLNFATLETKNNLQIK
jgi:hypothetical protein